MAELIDKDELIQIIDTASDNLSERLKAVFIDIVAELPTTTEAEIRAKAEHTYENCHNITCRRKCQKDGYNMAIDEFAEKLKERFALHTLYNHYDVMDGIGSVAEQMKGE